MAAQKQTLVSALVRIANLQGNPTGFLISIIQGNFTSATQGDGTILISTSTGGTSGTFMLPPGMDPFSIVELAELALQIIETGVDQVTTFSNGSPSFVPSINQLVNSKRSTSYGQFGNVQH